MFIKILLLLPYYLASGQNVTILHYVFFVYITISDIPCYPTYLSIFFSCKTFKNVELNNALSDAPVTFAASDVISHVVFFI